MKPNDAGGLTFEGRSEIRPVLDAVEAAEGSEYAEELTHQVVMTEHSTAFLSYRPRPALGEYYVVPTVSYELPLDDNETEIAIAALRTAAVYNRGAKALIRLYDGVPTQLQSLSAKCGRLVRRLVS